MPLNEAAGFRRSNLTREQKRQAEAAILGLPTQLMDSNSLSHEEIERMRMLVAQHDRSGKIEEFDLNHPPQQPYVYKEFPRILYHHAQRVHRTVRDAQEMNQYLEQGWSKEPYPAEPEALELDEPSAAEAADVNRQLKRRK